MTRTQLIQKKLRAYMNRRENAIKNAAKGRQLARPTVSQRRTRGCEAFCASRDGAFTWAERACSEIPIAPIGGEVGIGACQRLVSFLATIALEDAMRVRGSAQSTLDTLVEGLKQDWEGVLDEVRDMVIREFGQRGMHSCLLEPVAPADRASHEAFCIQQRNCEEARRR